MVGGRRICAKSSAAFVVQYVERDCKGDYGQQYSDGGVVHKAERQPDACPKGDEYVGFGSAGYGSGFLKVFYVCSQNLVGKQSLVQASAAFQKAVRTQQKKGCGRQYGQKNPNRSQTQGEKTHAD